jgi:hypothetical protein
MIINSASLFLIATCILSFGLSFVLLADIKEEKKERRRKEEKM